jgi:hypothetical protein
VYSGDSVFGGLKKTKTVNYSYSINNREGDKVNKNCGN